MTRAGPTRGVDDPRRLARYPFLPAASAYVAESGPSLEELLTDRAYARARARGRERALAAIRDGDVPADEPTDDVDAVVHLLSYGIARMLVSLADDKYVIRRHALGEGLRVKAFLEKEDPRVVEDVAEELGVPAGFEEDTQTYSLHFADYLRHAVVLKDTTWKLVNQEFAAPGRVRLPQPRLARLLQEAYRARAEGELPLPATDGMGAALAGDLAALVEEARVKKDQIQTESFGELDLDSLPPCMKHILGMIQTGVNAPHSARFAITSFLHTVGQDSEAIIKLFSKAPDFKEEMTRYQVEHITGKSGSTEYTPPGCQAMKTYGICYNADKWCESKAPDGHLYVTHPLSYYRWALKRKARAAGAPQTVPR